MCLPYMARAMDCFKIHPASGFTGTTWLCRLDNGTRLFSLSYQCPTVDEALENLSYSVISSTKFRHIGKP